MRNVIIIGAGENAVQVCNILKHDRGLKVVGLLDDNTSLVGATVGGAPVLGPVGIADDLRRMGRAEAAIVAIGNNPIRQQLTTSIRQLGYDIVSAVHPNTCIDDTARLGVGVIVEMGVMIHPEARVEDGVFIGGSSVVAHHCSIGEFTLIGGGVVFGGRVAIGPLCTIGVGTILQPHISIGTCVTTGIGCAVIKSLPDHAVAVGVPAKIIRYANHR